MNISKFLFASCVMACFGFVSDNTSLLPFFKGESSSLVFRNYNAKDEFDSEEKLQFSRRTGNQLVLNNKMLDDDGSEKDIAVIPTTVERAGESTAYHLSSFIFSTMGYRLETKSETNVEFPDNVKVGDVLKDARLTGDLFDKKDAFFGKFELSFTERKIVAQGEIKTAAGSFPAYQVEFKQFTRIGILKTTFKRNFWYNKEMGIIKTDKYTMKGKYKGKTELQTISK